MLNRRPPPQACRPPRDGCGECVECVETIEAGHAPPQRPVCRGLPPSMRPRRTARAAAFGPAPAGRRKTAPASAQDLHQRGQPLHQPLQHVQHGRDTACVLHASSTGLCACVDTPAPDQPLRAPVQPGRQLGQRRLDGGLDARPGVVDLSRFFRHRGRAAAITRLSEAPRVAGRMAARVSFTSGSHDRVPFESSPAETHAGIAFAKLIRPSPMPIRPSPIWLSGSPPGSCPAALVASGVALKPPGD